MASSGVFALTRFTSLASGDVIPVVDISDPTQNAHGSLDAITVANFFAAIPCHVGITTGGLTVSAGTTAVQALTATTGVFSSTITATGFLVTTGTSTVLGFSQNNLSISNSTDTVTINTATNTPRITITAAGVTFAAGISATTGTFSGATLTAASAIITGGQIVSNADVTVPGNNIGRFILNAGIGTSLLAETATNQVDLMVSGINCIRATFATAHVSLNLAESGGKLGFFAAAAPVVRQTILGSRGANAALASLLTALAAHGLVIDSTT